MSHHCSNCGRVGHNALKCGDGIKHCGNCGKADHNVRTCPALCGGMSRINALEASNKEVKDEMSQRISALERSNLSCKKRLKLQQENVNLQQKNVDLAAINVAQDRAKLVLESKNIELQGLLKKQ